MVYCLFENLHEPLHELFVCVVWEVYLVAAYCYLTQVTMCYYADTTAQTPCPGHEVEQLSYL